MTAPETMDAAGLAVSRVLLAWALGLGGVLVVLLAMGCDGARTPTHGASDGATVRVRIDGREWTVETATTPNERYRGLSYRTELPPGEGMLFVFPEAEHAEFCMRGCEIPLDIAFIDEAGVVVRTWTMAVEPDRMGRRGYPSGAPVLYALEVNAGQLADANIAPGSKMEILGDLPPVR
jgi:hypothetical protein